MPVGGGNPFWSEKATTEFRLAVSRPMDLPPERHPVPGDDEEVRRQLEQEEEQDFAAVENGSEERGGGLDRGLGHLWRRWLLLHRRAG